MRDRLPDRREAAIGTFEWGGFTWRVAIGMYPDGRGGEVFADALPGADVTATRIKVGSDIHGLVQDGCVLVSRLIQEGVPASAIAGMLGREGIDADAPAASILGRLAQVASELEIVDHGDPEQ